MEKIIFKTKLSIKGFIVLGFGIALNVIVLVANPLSIKMLLLCLGLLFTLYIVAAAITVRIEFYEKYFIVKYPLLSFVKRYRPSWFLYENTKRIEYVYWFRQEFLSVKRKDGKSVSFPISFQRFSDDKKKVEDIFKDMRVGFYYRRGKELRKAGE